MRRYLQFRNYKTGDRSTKIDVTGRNEREIEKITRGMLINIHDDWLVDDFEEDTAPVGRNAKRQDPQGLGPKDEHAVIAEGEQAPKASDGIPLVPIEENEK